MRATTSAVASARPVQAVVVVGAALAGFAAGDSGAGFVAAVVGFLAAKCLESLQRALA
jgi:hypothetical protein